MVEMLENNQQHRFKKMEACAVVKPEDGLATLQALTGHAEKVLSTAELPFHGGFMLRVI